MKIKKGFSIFIMCTICFVQKTIGGTVGSNTAASRQLKAFFRASDNSNQMIGFSLFENGFSLENSSTNCLFDALFPLSGGINLNGGVLDLARDTSFKNPLWIVPGIIDGHNYSLEFPSSVSSLSVPSTNHNKLLALCDVKDVSDETNDVSWSFDDTYIAVACDRSSGDELQIYSFVNGQLLLLDSYDFGNNNAYSVAWHPSDYYVAVGLASGDELFIFYFNTETSSLQLIDSANIGTVYDIAWSPDGQLLAVGQSRSDSLLVYEVANGVLGSVYTCALYSSDVYVAAHGLSWNSAGDCLAASFKINNFAYRLKIFSYDGESFSDNSYLEIGDRMGPIAFKPNSSLIAVGFTRGDERLRLYTHDSAEKTITEVTSGRMGEGRSIYDISWHGDYIAYVKDSSNITYELKVCYFDDSNSSFSLVSGQSWERDLNTLAWSNSGSYLVSGGINNDLAVFQFSIAPLVFKNIKLFFNSDVVINGNIIFDGTCSLSCAKNTLKILDGFSITVTDGSTLTLENTVLKGISGNKIICADQDCAIKLRNVTWLQDANYTFSTGGLLFEGDVLMGGEYIFAYQSTSTSRILSDTTLELDMGFTFSYNPVNSSSKKLIEMEDSTSMLLLDGARLHTTSQGMQFTKGKLRVLRDSYLSCEAVVSDKRYQTFEGITFGDNAIEDDVWCNICTGATLYITQGSLNYKNISDFSWNMASHNSFLHMRSATMLNVYQNLKLGMGMVIFDDRATLAKATGKEIVGSIKPFGKLLYTSLT